jgi:hypothetical protein
VVSQSRIEGSSHPAWTGGGTKHGGEKERRKESEAVRTAGTIGGQVLRKETVEQALGTVERLGVARGKWKGERTS